MVLGINISVTVVMLGIILWGSKFAGFGKECFHNDFMGVDNTKSIRGLAAIGVILHHISQDSYFQNTGTINAFVNVGPLMVAIFFFFSGFGLMKNHISKENYLEGFLKKRLVKGLLITFYINALIYIVFYWIKNGSYEPIKLVTDILGLTLSDWYAWFPVVLSLFYLAFYFVFKNVKNVKIGIFIMLIFTLAQGMFFCVSGHFAWWSGEKNWWLNPMQMGKAKWWQQEHIIWFFGEWWVNSSIAFIVGLVFAYAEDKIVPCLKKMYWTGLVLTLVLWRVSTFIFWKVSIKYGYYTEWSGKGPGITDKMITYVSYLPVIIFYILFIVMLMMKIKTSNPITRFFGKYSLDTYLVNLMALEIFKFVITDKRGNPLKKGDYHLVIYILAVFAVTLILAKIQNVIVSKVKTISSKHTGTAGSAKNK